MFPACVQRLFVLFSCLLTITSFAQQQPTPRTLLWRISGKGLQQPSYLYGTMHLQDKRLFQFGDSVYHAIENTSGLALEINFQEAVDSLFSNHEKEKEKDRVLAGQQLRLDRSKLDPTAVKLLQKFGVKGNVITAKQLKDINEYRMQTLLLRGEMPAIVDGFLLGIAQRQNKWTGGIEDVNDQLDLRDEMGRDLKAEAVLLPEKDFRRSVDSMMNIYIAQDLDKIDAWTNHAYQGETRDMLLIRRNVKMAYRMDSLSAVRPTFFAVGAAHLPGDSGVIALLRTRGFDVQPVFSVNRVPGDQYAARLKAKEWKLVKGEDDIYTVQMPGDPTDMNKPGEPKMKLLFDLASMTFYMTGHFNGIDAKSRSLDDAVRGAAKNIGGTELAGPPVSVVHHGLQGKEIVAAKDGYTFRIRVFHKDKTMFLLMAGAGKKEMVTGADAERFFTSFVPGETTVVKKPWNVFSPPGNAFTVRMPGTPVAQQKLDDKVAESPTWTHKTYYSTDPATSHFYMTQVRQVKASYTIENDSAYMEALKEEYGNRLEAIAYYETTTYHGYPASRMEFYDKTVNGVYKALHVVRGNQVYVLMGGAIKGSDMADIDTFLHSLVLLPYETTAWEKTAAPGFSTLAPAAFQQSPPDSTATNRRFSAEYTAYNQKDAVSYVVQKSVFSPNYWVANDSLFLEERLSVYKGESDSVLQKSWVQNGSVKGIDFVIQPSNHSGIKKVRLLVSKDTLYSLFASVQAREWNNGYHEKFFEDFRLQQEVPPTIYTKKAAQLLASMTTSDSTAFEDAMQDFESVSFGKEDLPLLHKALLETYRDSEDFYSTHNKLIERILPLADGSTVNFAREAYPTQKGEKEANQYRLLQLLAQIKTNESFGVLKPLLLADLPRSGNPIALQRPLLDSLRLSAALFPELLQKADDSLLAPVIAAVAGRLLDSGLLTRTTLKAYKQTLLRGVENEFRLFQKEEYEAWELVRWAQLLAWLNDEEGNTYLQRFLRQNDLGLKQAAILALLKNNLPVPAAEITKVAADRGTRLYFYETLQQAGKANLFPPLYASQKSLAESELYNLIADEDYQDFTLTYIGQRTVPFEGRTRLFHLFKVRLAYEEDGVKRNYLCVAGSYPLNGKEKILSSDATGIYTQEQFHPQKTDKQLKAYLLSLGDPEK